MINTRTKITGTALYLFLFFSVNAEAQVNPKRTIFDRWDKNNDGTLTREELPQNARPNFNRADKNNDGFISREEDKIFREQSGRRQKKGSRDQLNNDRIEIKNNIPYADTKNPRQSLNLILPKSRKKKILPALIYIHGGGWKNGNKDQGIARLLPYAESGEYVGISVGYRLSGEALWPAQIHDCKAAIRWVRGNAKKYDINPERIGVFGSSAGGHLVAMLGTSEDVKELEGSLGNHKAMESRVHCVGNFFGPSALLEMSKFPSRIDHDAANSPESQLIGGALQKNKTKAIKASPINYVTKDDCPFIHVHGTDDQLVPYNQSVIFHKKLLENGCNSTLITVKGGGHGGFKNDTIQKITEKFFAEQLLGKESKIAKSEVLIEQSQR
ncbi:MAG: alpha/beta hydrolase fold domain-containing protein [Akkermansiaceae bacterium]|jgi:acetyl esterase/lipase|nr:alpha/beta hydrolase fold domain-containing protein [Akkermansiaceae bacterium]